ncbi:MAG: gliding motility-associated C-terminal domain-containing protein [Bacteroidales bacterium]
MRKLFIIILLLIISISGMAQIIDTVCVNAVRTYHVQKHLHSIYYWHVTGCIPTSPLSLDSINVQWGNVSGPFQIYVFEKDTITGCTGDTVFGEVLVKPIQLISLKGRKTICYGDTVSLTVLNSISCIWSTGDVTNTIIQQPVSNAQYWVKASRECGPDTTINHNVTVLKPIADFSYIPEQPYAGEIINLSYTGGSSISAYKWYYENNVLFSSLKNPAYLIQNSEKSIICLNVTDTFGCPDDICKTIYTSGDINIWIPNSFTPNGDGINDKFKAETVSNLKTFTIYIYNRWGQLVFSSNNINAAWYGDYNGNEAQQGVYTWTILYQSANDPRQIIYRKNGHVTLIK